MNKSQNVKPPTNDVWEEEQLEAALERLRILYSRARDLRTAIQRMTEPLRQRQTAVALYNSYMTSVRQTTQEIQGFKAAMRDDETTKIFERAKQSRREQPQGIKPWNATEHADWYVPPE